MGWPSDRRGEAWMVALAAAFVFFLNLGGIALWDEDEPKNAVCAREMFQRGDWLVPTFNGQLRTDKPILLYWLMLTAYHALGVTEFAARVWSAVLSTVTVLLTYDLGRRFGVRLSTRNLPPHPDPLLCSEAELCEGADRGGEGESARSGLWSGLALAGSLLFGVSARAATPDATLIVCTTASLWLWATAFTARTPLTTTRRLGIYGLLGLAVLAKGPSGLVLPLAVMLTAETLVRWFGQNPVLAVPGRVPLAACPPVRERDLAPTGGQAVSGTIPMILMTNTGEAIRSLRVASGCVLAVLIAAPWYVAVGVATDGAWPAGFLGRHNVQRFLGPLEGHGGPIVYYIPAILIGLLPWSLWLPAALAGAWRRMRASALDRADVALLSWIGVYVVVFSFAGTKLPSYVLPCYPALAVLIGRHVARERERLPNGPFLGLMVIGLALSAAFVAADRWLMENLAWLAILGVIPAIGGLVAWRFNRRQRPQLALGAFAGAAALMLAGLFGIAAEAVDDRQTPVAFARHIQNVRGAGAPVATLDAFRPNLVFYAGGTITDCPTAAEAADFLTRSPEAFLVTRDEHWEQLRPLLPPDAALIARERMFLRKFDLLLIGRVQPPRTKATALRVGLRGFKQ